MCRGDFLDGSGGGDWFCPLFCCWWGGSTVCVGVLLFSCWVLVLRFVLFFCLLLGVLEDIVSFVCCFRVCVCRFGVCGEEFVLAFGFSGLFVLVFCLFVVFVTIFFRFVALLSLVGCVVFWVSLWFVGDWFFLRCVVGCCLGISFGLFLCSTRFGSVL